MALISPDSLERVKQTADIVEVISAHTDLRRQGARWVGLCPFHEERTPSFSVDPCEKLYHCFGCGVGGDTIKFVEEKEGLELHRRGRAARRPLRGRARARERGPAGRGAARSSAAASKSCSTAPRPSTRAYLWDAEEAGKARDYMAERGLGEEVLRAFGVGYAPSAWDTGAAARPAGRLQGRRAARRRAWPSAGAAAASTTASARGSCSRSETAAAARSASAAGRCAPTRAPSTSTPRRPTSSTRARCSTGSTWRRRRSPRRAGRSSSRATPTCSPCTRRGSRRRSG